VKQLQAGSKERKRLKCPHFCERQRLEIPIQLQRREPFRAQSTITKQLPAHRTNHGILELGGLFA
jgi:hypothetical protein